MQFLVHMGLVSGVKKLGERAVALRPFKVLSNRAIGFAIAFVVVGGATALLTRATTPSVGVEGERGQMTGLATQGTDSNASGGAYVLFSQSPPVTNNPFDIPDTNYSIPAGAKYVKPTGDDTKDCSSDTNACKTITRGVQAAGANGVLVVRGGVYRERIGGATGRITNAVTIQAYPHEKPWVDGSTVLASTSWTPDSGTGGWVYNNWNPAELCRTNCMGSVLDSTTGITHYVDGSTSAGGAAVNPAAKYVDQLFLNGTNLTQVATKAELAPGKFFIDYATDQIYLKNDPTTPGTTVEASTHAIALYSLGASNVNIKGIGFRRFASTSSSSKDPAAVMIGASSLLENVVVIDSAGSGVLFQSASGTIIRDTKVAYNGFVGLRGNGGTGVKIVGGRYAYNNTELFVNGSPAAVASGIKVTSASGFVVEDAEIDHNKTNGLWCDVRCDGAIWVRNYIHDNELAGTMYEISQNGTIASNKVIRNNTRHSSVAGGIKIASSANVNAFNNTAIDNFNQIIVTYDGRTVSGLSTLIQGINLQNNLLIRSTASGNDTASQLLYTLQTVANPPTTQEFFLPVPPGGIDYNGYWRPSTSSPSNLAYFNNKVNPRLSLTSLAQLQAQGYETNGIYGDTSDTAMPIKNIANEDFALTSAGAAKYIGSPLTSAQVAFICKDLPANCVPTGIPVVMGYLQ